MLSVIHSYVHGYAHAHTRTHAFTHKHAHTHTNRSTSPPHIDKAQMAVTQTHKYKKNRTDRCQSIDVAHL